MRYDYFMCVSEWVCVCVCVCVCVSIACDSIPPRLSRLVVAWIHYFESLWEQTIENKHKCCLI